MKLLAQLLDVAASVIPKDLHERVVVFGSAPMVFADLKADVTFDLDLFVDAATYRALLGAGFTEDNDERGLARIMVAGAVEVVCEWPGVTFEEVFAASTRRDSSRGFRIAALEHVLAFKEASPREKDQREAEIIRRTRVAPLVGEHLEFIPITPGRLPGHLLRIAGAIELASARNPGFWQNHVHTGVAVRLDLRSTSLDEPLRVALTKLYPGHAEVLFIERRVRGQLDNLTAAVARLDEAIAGRRT